MDQLRQTRKPTTCSERIKWWKIKWPTSQSDPDQTVEAIWKWAVDNIHHAAESIMGKTKPGQKVIDKQTWKGKGDVSECANYRPIRLLSHKIKIFERVLEQHIRSIVTSHPISAGSVPLMCSAADRKTTQCIWPFWTWRTRLS